MGRYQARLADRLQMTQCDDSRGDWADMRGFAKSHPRYICDQIDVPRNAGYSDWNKRGCFLMPPFKQMWIEWFVRAGNGQCIGIGSACEMQGSKLAITLVQWMPAGFHYLGQSGIELNNGTAVNKGFLWSPFQKTTDTEIGQLVCLWHILRVEYSLALINCRGVTTAHVSQPGGCPPVGRMKGKELTYKTLLIGSRKSHHESVPFHEIQGIIRAHMRRGNIANYSEERPHVSGFVGPMWRSACVVGDPKNGKVVKDYEIRP